MIMLWMVATADDRLCYVAACGCIYIYNNLYKFYEL